MIQLGGTYTFRSIEHDDGTFVVVACCDYRSFNNAVVPGFLCLVLDGCLVRCAAGGTVPVAASSVVATQSKPL